MRIFHIHLRVYACSIRHADRIYCNKTGTLPHGISEVAISTKLEISRTGTLPHGISGFADSAKAGNQQNWNLWCCIFGAAVLVDHHIANDGIFLFPIPTLSIPIWSMFTKWELTKLEVQLESFPSSPITVYWSCSCPNLMLDRSHLGEGENTLLLTSIWNFLRKCTLVVKGQLTDTLSVLYCI